MSPVATDERFRKSDRLRKRREYLSVQRRGRKIQLRDLLVLVLHKAGQRRVGITVSSKVGCAVVRNQIKRWLREIWRRDRNLLPTGYEMVFIAKRRAASANFGSLRSQFRTLSRKLS